MPEQTMVTWSGIRHKVGRTVTYLARFGAIMRRDIAACSPAIKVNTYQQPDKAKRDCRRCFPDGGTP